MDSTKRNGAGYYDPTAFQAIKNTEKGAKKTMEIYRGDIFYIKKINQDTGRPAVIVSNNDINESQNMVEVAYLVEKVLQVSSAVSGRSSQISLAEILGQSHR